MRRGRRALCVSAIVVSLCIVSAAVDNPQQAKAKSSLANSLAQLPLAFEANRGQADSSTRFVARGSGYTVLLRNDSAVLSLSRKQGSEQPPQQATVAIRLDGARANTEPAAETPLPGKVNYLLGNLASQWRTGIPTFARVRFAAVYPGVDLVYYGNQRQLEYDFEVAPGADASRIRLRFDGADKLEIADGALLIHSVGGDVRMLPPVIYQEVGTGRKTVAGHYELLPGNVATISIGDYDHRRKLVIDPVLAYSTYFGNTSFDQANAIAVDSANPPNAYVTGEYCSSAVPAGLTPTTIAPITSVSGCNAYVLKVAETVDVNGNVTGTSAVFLTFFGGTSSTDNAQAIALDPGSSAPTIYLAGFTFSTNFPTTSGAFQGQFSGQSSAFYTHLDATGATILYSTFLAGAGVNRATGIAVDPGGNVYLSGTTTSLAETSGTTAKSTSVFPLVSPLVSDTHGGVYSSSNAGSSWSLLRSGTMSQNITSPDIRSLAIAPAYSTPVSMPSILYAGTSAAGLWTSSDAGQTWTHSTNGLSPTVVVNALVIDPTSPAVVYAATSGGVYKTTNSGASWAQLGTLNANISGLARDNSGAFYAASFGTLYYLPSGATTWLSLTPPVASGNYTSFTAVATNPAVPGTSPATIYAGNNNYPDSLYYSTNGGATWTVAYSGVISNILSLVTSADGATLYVGTQFYGVWSCVTSTMVCTQGHTATGGQVVNYQRGFAISGSTVYTATSYGIFKSVDAGITWSDVSNGITANDLYPVVIDPADSNHLFFGSSTQDAFIASFNSSGALRYSTLWGGGRFDNADAIAADANGNAYMVGQTYSNGIDFPFTNGIANGRLAYLTKFSYGTSLSAAYSLPIGGNSTSDVPRAIALAFDPGQVTPDPNVYVTGQTCAGDLAVVNAYQSSPAGGCDAFLFKAQPSTAGLGAVFQTYFGGNNGEQANGIAIDPNGNVWIAGQTASTSGFPAVNAPYPYYLAGSFSCGAALQSTCQRNNAFVAQFDKTGSLLFSTYFGGQGDDYAQGVAVDSAGNAYVAGYTYSTNLPTRNALQTAISGTPDAFVARFDVSASRTDVGVSLSNTSSAGCYNPTGNSTSSGCALNYSAEVDDFDYTVGANNITLTISPIGSAATIATTDSRCAIVGSSIRCSLGHLDPGGPQPIALCPSTCITTVNFSVTPLDAGTLTVRAGVSEQETDSSPSNNLTSNSVTVVAAYNVGLTATHAPEPVVRGVTTTETVTVTNQYDAVSSVQVLVITPTAITNYGTCGAGSGNTQAYCVTGSLGTGQSQSFSLTYLAPTTTGTYTTSAQVYSSVPTLTSNPGTINDTINVVVGADLSLVDNTIYPGANSFAVPGDQVTLHTVVANNGPDTATNVVLTTVLSPGLQIISLPSNCTANSATSITCTFSSMQSGANTSRDIVVQPAGVRGRFFTATDRVSSDLADPNGLDDLAYNRVELRPSATASQRMVVAGSVALHMFNVANLSDVSPLPPRADATSYTRAFSPNGRIVFGPRSVIDVPAATEIGRVLSNAAPRDVFVTDDGTRLIYPSSDDTVRIVDAVTLQSVGSVNLNGLVGDDPNSTDIYPTYTVIVGSVAYIAPTGTNTTTLARLPLIKLDFSSCMPGATGPCAPAVSTIPGTDLGFVYGLFATPDGRYVLESTYVSPIGYKLLVVDTLNPTNIQQLTMPTVAQVYRAAITSDPNDPQGTWFYFSSGNRLYWMDLRTASRTYGVVNGPVTLPSFSVYSMALTADGSTLAMLGYSNGYAVATLSAAGLRAGQSTWSIPPTVMPDISTSIMSLAYIDTVAPNPPQITSIDPEDFLNDQPVTLAISGSNFSSDARVNLRPLGLLTPFSVSPTQLLVNIPQGAPISRSDVVVTNVNAALPFLSREVSAVSDSTLKISAGPSYQPSQVLVAVNAGDQTVTKFGRGIYNTYQYYPGNYEYFLSADGGRLYSNDYSTLSAFDFATQQSSAIFQAASTANLYEGIDWMDTGTDIRSGKSTAFLLVEGQTTYPNPITLSVVAIDVDPSSTSIGQEMYRVTTTLPDYNAYGDWIAVTPNGRFAFAISPDFVSSSTVYSLYTYDLMNGTVSGGVALAGLGFSGNYNTNPPYVTPDGAYLIITDFSPTGSTHVLAIDPNTGALTQLATISPTPPSQQLYHAQLYNVAVRGSYLYGLDPRSGTMYAFNFQPGVNTGQVAAYVINGGLPTNYLYGTSSNLLPMTADGSLAYIASYSNVFAIDTALLRAGSNPVVQTWSPGYNPVQVLLSPESAPSLDLSLSMTGPSLVAPGAQITYNFQATNPSSTIDLPSTVLRDPLPLGTTFVSAGGCLNDPVNGTQCGTCFYDAAQNTIECGIGHLTPSSTVTGTIVLQAPSTAATITNSALLLSATVDPNTVNNQASVSTRVASIDLALTVTSSGSGYTATVRNIGSSDATNVVVTDSLVRYGFVSASTSRGTCAFSNGAVSCPVGTILAGGSDQVTINVVATAPSSGWASNNFHATASEFDTNPVNNSVQIGPVLEAANTPAGQDVNVQAGDPATGAIAQVTYSAVNKAGTTELAATSVGPPPPAGYRAGTPLIYYNLTTSAQTSGAMAVSVSFFGVQFHHPDRARVFHLENGAWVDRTVSVNVVQSVAAASTSSLSTFAVFEPVNNAPVANAGADRTIAASITAGAQVALDATGSSDADGDALTYRWTGPFPEGSGVASGARPTVTLPFGVSQLTLVVSDGEASAASSVKVVVSDFGVAANTSSATISSGSTAQYALAISPKFGSFDAPVTLGCANVPVGMECSFSQATVTPGASGANVTLSVTASRVAASRQAPMRHAPWLAIAVLFAPFGFVAVGALENRRLRWIVLGGILLVLVVMAGCAGGGTSSPAARPSTTSTVTVTATSAGVAHSTTVSITVQ